MKWTIDPILTLTAFFNPDPDNVKRWVGYKFYIYTY
jgi:hypothetical protein